MPTTSLLVILDGFGHSTNTENNAIAMANMPAWDDLWGNHPHTLISGSGIDVGLPDGQMGNSEVGHMNLGSGRVVYQDFTRINKSIEDGDFADNPALVNVTDTVIKSGGALHVMGLLSPGGVHSHEEQIFSLIKVAAAKGIRRIYLHAFLDGRDTPPRSAKDSLAKADALFAELQCGQVISVSGRYFAMDRDRNWDRLERAYNLMALGEAPFHATTGVEALENAYQRDENDEFVQPTAIHPTENTPFRLCARDAVVFMNFRADRARQITRAMTEAEFDGFPRRSFIQPANFTTLTQYAQDLDLPCAFNKLQLLNSFGEHLQNKGMKQLRIAETEKYAHVTFFFSGGREDNFDGEERLLVPSPKVATYDLQPEMSAKKVTDELIEAIENGRFDTIVCNYANGDMVGHSGKLQPAIKAVETLDDCLLRLRQAIEKNQGQMLVTADHGNVEQMVDPKSAQEHTAHTSNLVPLVYVGPQKIGLRDGGSLCDVAPTLLDLMGLDIPAEMTGKSLVTGDRP
jgi:2,3-bisphosphoglycerate-independent phosphoglycerate mutase